VRVGGQAVVLYLATQLAGSQLGHGFDHGLGAERGQTIMQAAASVLGSDGGGHLEQHGAGVQARFHLHHGDAAAGVAGLDGALDRRRAAPARQQRGVAVDAAQARSIQHHLWQDQAIGDHYHQVRRERGQFGLGGRVAQGLRLVHGDAVLQSQLFDRAGHQFLPAAGRAIRLGIDGYDLPARVEQGLQVLGGEFRGAGEDDTHGSLTA